MAMSGAPQGSQSALREANSRRILDAIHSFGGITQVELAAATGLSAATVSTIVKQLLEHGVVDTRTTTRSGRRARLVTLARRTGLAVGVHVGHRQVRVAIGETAHDVLAEQSLPLPQDHRMDTTLDRVALLVVELVEDYGASVQDVVGVGVAIAAPIDPVSRCITAQNILRGWEGVPIADVLSTRLGTEVMVDNDATLGALAESRFGAARGSADVVFVRASYSTGTGIVLGGKVHRGRRGTAGEIGHVEVDGSGAICVCGSRGCLNTVVGADALIDRLRVSRGPMTLGDVVEYAMEGDPGCRQVVADAGATIGAAVAGLALAVDPECIVIGGELAETGDILIGPLRDVVMQRVLLAQPEPVAVRQAQLGQRAEVTGALALVLDSSPFAVTTAADQKD